MAALKVPTKYRRYLMGYNTRFQTQSASGSCVLWGTHVLEIERPDMQTGFFRLIPATVINNTNLSSVGSKSSSGAERIYESRGE